MDINFHSDDFERLLREKSDEFRMYPSKRIWHSVYNNIHPGRKWPSIAMTITLISTLLLVGYLNSKNNSPYITGENKKLWQQEYALVMSPRYIPQSINDYHHTISIYAGGNITRSSITEARLASPIKTMVTTQAPQLKVSAIAAVYLPKLPLNKATKISQPVVSDVAVNNQPVMDAIDYSNKAAVASEMINEGPVMFTALSSPETSFTSAGEEKFDSRELASYNPERITINADNELQLPLVDLFKAEVLPSPLLAIGSKTNSSFNNDPLQVEKAVIGANEKDWMEHYALYNRPATKKWASKLSWQVYATPSVVYRTLYNDPGFRDPPSANTPPLAVSPASQDVNMAVTHTPSLGMEIGTGLKYSIGKGISLKGGLQVNYTRYNAHAYHNAHPVATKLTMHDFRLNTSYEVYRTSPYSNKNGLESIKLHNETFQVAIPLGMDVKLLGNDQVQWNMGVTLQPTYVIAGRAYLISSDRRNYVQESNMLNHWNLNAGFETFLSFQSNGLTWQVGPQLRSQLFSTNNRKFAIQERLMTYGLKFGVSKTIR